MSVVMKRLRPASVVSRRVRRMAPKQKVLCAEDDFEHVLPPGPASLDEIATWPEDLLRRALRRGPQAQEVLMIFIAGKFRFSTDYSGFDCPRKMMHQIQCALDIVFFQRWILIIVHPFTTSRVPVIRERCRNKCCSGFARSWTRIAHAC